VMARHGGLTGVRIELGVHAQFVAEHQDLPNEPSGVVGVSSRNMQAFCSVQSFAGLADCEWARTL